MKATSERIVVIPLPTIHRMVAKDDCCQTHLQDIQKLKLAYRVALEMKWDEIERTGHGLSS